MNHRILFIDDNVYDRELYVQALEIAGYSVNQATSVESAIQKANESSYDVVVIDLMMPPGGDLDAVSTKGGFITGARLIQPLLAALPNAKIVGLSSSPDSTAYTWFQAVGGIFCQKQTYPPFEFAERIKNFARNTPMKPKAFIVHGHDTVAKLELKNYLQNKLGFDEPIILSEQASRGRTIMEKFEEHAHNSDLAFALLTPDDFASDDDRPRARQNVIFELGYFLGVLGRKTGRVFVLKKGDVEIPSDLQGVVYIDVSSGVEAAGERIRTEIGALLN